MVNFAEALLRTRFERALRDARTDAVVLALVRATPGGSREFPQSSADVALALCKRYSIRYDHDLNGPATGMQHSNIEAQPNLRALLESEARRTLERLADDGELRRDRSGMPLRWRVPNA